MRKDDMDGIIKCPKCKSQIAVDNRTIWPIDCDCGQEVTKTNAITED